MEETLVGPLGLGAISYDAPQFNTFEAAAQGYRYFEDPVPAGNKPVPNCSLYTMSPAGSISMSSPQLAKWDTLFLNRGTVDGRRIISEEMCSQLFTPQMLCSDPIAEPLQGYLSLSTYGMGFFIDSYRGASVVQHGGHIDGFIADQCFVPEKNFACAVLTNSEHPYGARVMRYHLLDAVLGLESVDWTGRFFSFYEEQQKNAGGGTHLSHRYPRTVRGLAVSRIPFRHLRQLHRRRLRRHSHHPGRGRTEAGPRHAEPSRIPLP